MPETCARKDTWILKITIISVPNDPSLYSSPAYNYLKCPSIILCSAEISHPNVLLVNNHMASALAKYGNTKY